MDVFWYTVYTFYRETLCLRGICYERLRVCVCIRHTHTSRCYIHFTSATPHDSVRILVFRRQRSWSHCDIFITEAPNTHAWAGKNSDFQQMTHYISKMVQYRHTVYMKDKTLAASIFCNSRTSEM